MVLSLPGDAIRRVGTLFREVILAGELSSISIAGPRLLGCLALSLGIEKLEEMVLLLSHASPDHGQLLRVLTACSTWPGLVPLALSGLSHLRLSL